MPVITISFEVFATDAVGVYKLFQLFCIIENANKEETPAKRTTRKTTTKKK